MSALPDRTRQSARVAPACSDADLLASARQAIRAEAGAVSAMADRLDDAFPAAVRQVLACQGCVVASGVGKAGWISQKLSATLASLGIGSQFLHPTEAVHGDLGRVAANDLILMLSFSGETEEVVRLLPWFADHGTPVIAITRSRASTLGRAAAVTIEMGDLQEACSMGLAPTASTAAMLAVGDALALACSNAIDFRPEDFARFHPGGSLGKRLATAEQWMRPLDGCRVACHDQTVREALVSQRQPGRRSGAMLVVDASDRLVGLFTDSDLSRLLERQDDAALDGPLQDVMTRSPKVVARDARGPDILQRLEDFRISELPVVDEQHRPLGVIDVTDLVGFMEPTPRSSGPDAPDDDNEPRILAFPGREPPNS